MAHQQVEAVGAVIPELRRGGVADLAHRAAVANLELMAEVLLTGRWSDLATPEPVETLVRRLAWDAVDLDLLARAYRIGQEWLYDDIRAHCASLGTSAGEAVTLLGELGHAALRFSDLSTTAVLERYRDERSALDRNADARRAQLVQGLLEGKQVDLARLENTLQYGFAGVHTAVRFSTSAATELAARTTATLRNAATETIAALGSPQSLTIQDQPDGVMLWVRSTLDQDRVDGLVKWARHQSEVCCGVGRPGTDVDGFRNSSEQADRACVLGSAHGDVVTNYADVALTALLLEDERAARSFVSAELGDLTGPGPINDALRATLRAFLANQCRVNSTSRILYLHRNTVSERLRRIESILNLAIADRAPELDAALRIHAHLGGRLRDQAANSASS